MNYKDLTPEERKYYDKIKARGDDSTWVLKNLAIFTGIFVIVTLIVLFM